MFKKFNLLLAIVLFSAVSLFSQAGLLMPTPRVLNEALVEGTTTVFPAGEYHFTEWLSTSTAATYPRNMLFYTISATTDPDIVNDLGAVYTDVYNSTSSGKINGRDANGISMGNSGSTRLGAAVVALNTTGRSNISVAWSASTLVAATGFTGTNVGKIYSYTLQYRLSETGAWTTVPNNTFNSSATPNVIENFSGILPAACDDQPLVQLRWIYYWSNRTASTSGSTRPRIGLDDIHITSIDMSSLTPNNIALNQFSQNPVSLGLPFNLAVKTRFNTFSAGIKAETQFVLSIKNADNTYTDLRTTPVLPIGTINYSFDNLTLSTLGTNTLNVRTLTDIGLTAAEFDINVIDPPTKIWFGDILTKGHAGSALPKFTAIARDASSNTTAYNGPMTIELADGTVLATATAVNGVAEFNNISFAAAGNYTIVAKATGVAAFDQKVININPAVEFEEILVPGYMAGCGNSTATAGYNLTDFAEADRNSNTKYNWTVPAYALVKLKNLHTGLEYRYTSRVQLVNNSTPTTVGNDIYFDEVSNTKYYSGRYITIAGTDSLKTPEPYSSFISTTANKAIWMNVVPNTYSYFYENTRVNWVMHLATEKGNVFAKFRTTDTTKALKYGANAGNITGIAEKLSKATEGHYMALYTGFGDTEALMSIAFVQNDGVVLVDNSGLNPDGTPYAQSGPSFYKLLDNVANSWATIIPNSLGVTKIVEYDKEGNVIKTLTDPDGIWGETDTKILDGGMVSPVYFNTPDLSTVTYTFKATNCESTPMIISASGLYGVNKVDIYYVYSNDNGLTYSASIKIADAIPTTLESNGNFGLTYAWNITQFANYEKPLKLMLVATDQTNVTGISTNTFQVFKQPEFSYTSGNGVYCKGSRIVLMAQAGGTLLPGNAGYRWYRDNKLIDGANGPTYVIASANFDNSGVYTCEAVPSAGNPCGAAFSKGLVVYIEEDTRIVKDPQPVYNQLGGRAKFTVEAQTIGLPPEYMPSYQWYKNGVALTDNAKYIGATSPELYIFNITAEDAAADYYAKVTGLCKSATSQSAKIYIMRIDVLALTPNQTLCEGEPMILAVTASSPIPNISYQWIKNGSEVSGANNDTLAFAAVTVNDAGKYRVKITDITTNFSILTNEITVIVNTKPQIIAQPDSIKNVRSGDVIELSTVANSSIVTRYQWYKDGDIIDGETNATYQFAVITEDQAGIYLCKLSNDCGEISTREVKVNLIPGGYAANVKDELNGFELYSANPNPTKETSSIKYFTPEYANIKLTLNDANGRQIAILANEAKAAGMHEVNFDAKALNLSAGTYFYVLTVGDKSLVNKVTVVK